MKIRFLLVIVPLILWQCATPKPVVVIPPPVSVAPVVATPDDDHRSVSIADFQKSRWNPLPALTQWRLIPGGVALSLQDGRELQLTFVSPKVVRWWVPAGAGDHPLSPSAKYPEEPVAVKTHQDQGTLHVDGTDLGVRLKLDDLSWTLVRGDNIVLSTIGGPQGAGRRLVQAFSVDSAERWVGPGLTKDSSSAKFWIDNAANADNTGPWAAPSLFGVGGAAPFDITLDNSYQTYTRIADDRASLGALNGGLDLLVCADSRASGVLAALTQVTGRPSVPPLWAHGTALVLPAGESGTFIRKARLSIQTAFGPFQKDRTRFQVLLPGRSAPGALPDLTLDVTRSNWVANLDAKSWPIGSGVALPTVSGRQDWSARFDDHGQDSPLARMNNQLAGIEAQTVTEVWQAESPGLRPFVLAESGGLGSVRNALPERRVVAGQDADLLAQALSLGACGQATAAIRLDLTPLTHPETKTAAFRSLLSWLMVPVLILDWGPDPAAFWTALDKIDQQRLKAILDCRSLFKPLFAQSSRQAAATGLPAWRSLWFDSPKDPKALNQDQEFLVGDTLLVAAVSKEGTSTPVYLPGPGVWFDFWSGDEFGGGRNYDVESRPDKPLVFVRGGSFVPVREAESFDGKDVYNPITIHVFPGGRGEGTYWYDDGRSLAWKDGTFVETKVSLDFSQKDMTLQQQSLNLSPGLTADPYVLYRLHNVYRPRQVQIDNKAIPLFGDSWGITDTDRSASWYESDHTLLIKTFHPEKSQTIQMFF